MGLLVAPHAISQGQPTEPPRAEATADPEGSGGAAPAATPVLDKQERLRRTVEKLSQLLEGALPAEEPVQALFDVDLLDDEAVQARITQLRLHAPEELEPLAADAPIDLLEQHVDALRLKFLSLPADERARVSRAEMDRRQLAREKEAAEQAASQAQEKEIQAERRRQQALERADQHLSALIDDLNREIARGESVRSELAKREQELARRAVERTQQSSAALERLLALEAKARDTTKRSDALDSLFDIVVEEFELALTSLEEAIDAWSKPPTVPRFERTVDLGGVSDPSALEQVNQLEQLEKDIRTESSQVRQKVEDEAWAEVERSLRRASAVNGLRVGLMPELSRARRETALSKFSREGFQRAEREVHYLVLRARAYLPSRSEALQAIPQRARDIFSVGTASVLFLRSVAVLLIGIVLWRRREVLLERMQNAIYARADNPNSLRWARDAMSLARGVLPWLLVLVVLWLLAGALGPAAAWPESRIVLQVLRAYAVYRLAVELVTALIRIAARRYQMSLSAARQLKLTRSARRLLSTGLAIVITLGLVRVWIGRGYLYNLLLLIGWIVLFVVALWIVRSWREEVGQTFAKIYPESRMAARLRLVRGKPGETLMSVIAAVWLLGYATVTLTRSFAMRFENVRKFFASLSRRRIERSVESSEALSQLPDTDLPERLVEAFSSGFEIGKARLNHVPGSDSLYSLIERWQGGQGAGDFLLVGERGMGKSTWLGAIEHDELPITRTKLTRRPRNPADLPAMLAPDLVDESGEAVSLRELRRHLNEGERKIIVVDDCHYLMLATVGGYDSLEEFADLVETTNEQVFWVCAFGRYAWNHIAAVRPDLTMFTHKQELPAWSESEIRALIDQRMGIGKTSVSFDDLVVGPIAGVSSRAHLLETQEGFVRIVWDYSNGNPQIALHFWLQSLVPEGENSVRVRLFKVPPSETFENLRESALFIIAALIRHESMTLREVATTTRYSPANCRLQLDRLVNQRIVQVDDGRYRLTTHCYRAVVHSLKRRNLLVE